MKDFIVLIAVLLILLPFPLQYALEEYNHHQKAELQSYVYAAKEKAKQQGYFSKEIINELEANITKTFNISKENINIEATKTPKYRTNNFSRRELIYYKVEIPIRKIIAVPKIWGINDQENKTVYTIEGYTSSEAIMP
jgi:uncharacterized membrane protein YgaE (UPF0421/DUF939 family)